MIEWIKIRGLALIDSAEIEFSPGLNIISGETGAGKTVFMSAISILLGERADKSLIRNGADFCEISASFRLGGELARKIAETLSDCGIDASSDESLLFRRRIGQSSSKCVVNDSPCSLELMRKLGETLIDTHGPHEHQSLLKPSLQLEVLDGFRGASGDLEFCAKAYGELVKAEQELSKILADSPSEGEIDLLKKALREIEAIAPQLGEDEELALKHKTAASAHDLAIFSGKASSLLDSSDSSVTERISEVHKFIREIEKLDPASGADFAALCQSLKDSASSLASSLDDYACRIELDEQSFAAIEERMRGLQTLKRRYGPRIEDVIAYSENARAIIALSENRAGLLSSLKVEIERHRAEHRKYCSLIESARKKASAKFAESVERELRELGFIKASFAVRFDSADPGPRGSDKIEFMFSANPGEGMKPIREIASSGEISRLMLALKTVLAETDGVPTLIFDEIDVNIGGVTASVVGEKLKRLAVARQVICITHLPQVAASGDRHLKVEKSVSEGRTFTEISVLDAESRKSEIARMLGGTKAAEIHAAELLTNSDVSDTGGKKRKRAKND